MDSKPCVIFRPLRARKVIAYMGLFMVILFLFIPSLFILVGSLGTVDLTDCLYDKIICRLETWGQL